MDADIMQWVDQAAPYLTAAVSIGGDNVQVGQAGGSVHIGPASPASSAPRVRPER